MYNCLIFGTGLAFIRRRMQLNYNFINIIGLLDNNEMKWDNDIDGITIDSPNNINKYEYDFILIASS